MMQQADIRTRLDQAAIRLFARQGVAGTSVRDIAQLARIADGTLYRHYSSKDAMARSLFERHYTSLGASFLESAARHEGIAAKLRAVIAGAYELFDNERELFGFILLSQHDHLAAIGEPDPSPVNVIRDLLADAMKRGEIASGDAEFAASLALGIALQPAVFTVYGRLDGPLSARAGQVATAVLDALGGGHET
ncbi:MAG: TetR/AcrR family transcriptional regulator [Geminicoccaceae bacterium]|nr:TetR/AcrR family transcriptional regulator [Geminicoccaceae bacterium]